MSAHGFSFLELAFIALRGVLHGALCLLEWSLTFAGVMVCLLCITHVFLLRFEHV